MDKLQEEWNNFKSSQGGKDGLEENWEKFKAGHPESDVLQENWDKLKSDIGVDGLKQEWNNLQDTRHKFMTGLQLLLFLQAQSPIFWYALWGLNLVSRCGILLSGYQGTLRRRRRRRSSLPQYASTELSASAGLPDGLSIGNTVIIPVNDIVLVKLGIKKNTTIRAGQYIQLCIPDVSTSAFIQQHPFYISWIDDYHDMRVICFLITPKRGFTEDLVRRANEIHLYKPPAKYDGPFGVPVRLKKYGTIVAFATGIGITGVLLYLKEALLGCRKHTFMARKIQLFWILEREDQQIWVGHWMEELLIQDVEKNLEVNMYIPRQWVNPAAKEGLTEFHGENRRISKRYEKMRVRSVVSTVIRESKGCTHNTAAKVIRETVVQKMDRPILFHQLDFVPSLAGEEVIEIEAA
ncbi:hypothetical protein TWF225_001656 [Orbilia oligospora]|nr:hypothetical protein TWF225_001656 [Orbilia oligospora]KAF3275827.1 hypothetical protein TWF132_002598 [Orbilia oligospora]